MVERAIQVEAALLHVVTTWEENIMTYDNFETMMADIKVFNTCLTVLKEVTTRIQADKYPTIAGGINHFLAIKKNLSNIIAAPGTAKTKELATVLRSRLQRRLGHMLKTGLPLCAAGLDLRYCHQVPSSSLQQLKDDLLAYIVTANSDIIARSLCFQNRQNQSRCPNLAGTGAFDSRIPLSRRRDRLDPHQ